MINKVNATNIHGISKFHSKPPKKKNCGGATRARARACGANAVSKTTKQSQTK